jgi:hypothetical protein
MPLREALFSGISRQDYSGIGFFFRPMSPVLAKEFISATEVILNI